MNEELYELNVIDKPFRFPDEFRVIWKSQTCRINSFINRWERVKRLVCEFGIILFFWIHVNAKEFWLFFVMHVQTLYFYMTEFYKRVEGTLLIDGVGGLNRENI